MSYKARNSDKWRARAQHSAKTRIEAEELAAANNSRFSKGSWSVKENEFLVGIHLGSYVTKDEGDRIEEAFIWRAPDGRLLPKAAPKQQMSRTAHSTPVMESTDEQSWRKQGYPARTYLCVLCLDGEPLRFKIGKCYDPSGCEPRCQEYALVWDDYLILSELEGDYEDQIKQEFDEHKIPDRNELFYAVEEIVDWFNERE